MWESKTENVDKFVAGRGRDLRDLRGIVNGLRRHVKSKDLNDVVLPLTNGKIEISRGLLFLKQACSYTPTESQLNAAYLKVAKDTWNSSINFLFRRSAKVNGGTTEYFEKITTDLWRSGLFKSTIIYPDRLLKKRATEVDGLDYVKFDEENYEIAKAIANEAKNDGFPLQLRDYKCFKEVCICPKEIDIFELITSASKKETAIRICDSDKYLLANIKIKKDKINISSETLVRECWSDFENVLKSFELELDKNGTVTYKESRKSEIKGNTKRALKTAGSSIGAAFMFLPALCYAELDKYLITPYLEKQAKKRKIILGTLQEGKAVSGPETSCIIFADEACMLERAEKKKLGESEQKSLPDQKALPPPADTSGGELYPY